MDDIRGPIPVKPVRFMDIVREAIRARQLAYKTEKTYCYWVADFIRFHKMKHPKDMYTKDVDQYLSHLAVQRLSIASTQRTALNSIIFVYKHVLNVELGQLSFAPSSRPRTLPTVFSHNEAKLVIEQLSGTPKLAAMLMYGAGLRIMEAVRLRVQDIDFANHCIMVREAKGGKWRRTLLPNIITEPLKQQVAMALSLHQQDLSDDCGEVYLPNALAKKYPNAAKDPIWQYVFPANRLAIDPRSNVRRRHHIGEQQIQRAVKAAIKRSGVLKKSGCHTFSLFNLQTK